MGINLNGQFLFLLHFPAFVHDPRNQDDDSPGYERSEINTPAETEREEFHPLGWLVLKQNVQGVDQQPVYHTQHAQELDATDRLNGKNQPLFEKVK
jgi:hypothetical protein